VGGTALALAQALAVRSIATRFIVPRPYGAQAHVAGLDVEEIPAEAGALRAELVAAGRRGERAFLHYANYGYQARGCPLWLAAGLHQAAEVPLWTHFHEVWATGPPSTSSFWLAPVQRRIAAAVARRSARISTGLPLYAGMIRRTLGAPEREIAIRPTVSAVGEPAEIRPFPARNRRLAVFGGAGIRTRAYGEHAAEIAAACLALDLSEVWDVGPGTVAPESVGPHGGSIPVRRLGSLPAAEVSALLSETAAGFLAYPLGFLGKSSAFAAYAAHGVLAVCAGRAAPPGAVPAPGAHFWVPETGTRVAVDPTGLADIAAAARSWYEGHSLVLQAAEIAGWLEMPPEGPVTGNMSPPE